MWVFSNLEVFPVFFHNILVSATTQQMQQTQNFIVYATTSGGSETAMNES